MKIKERTNYGDNFVKKINRIIKKRGISTHSLIISFISEISSNKLDIYHSKKGDSVYITDTIYNINPKKKVRISNHKQPEFIYYGDEDCGEYVSAKKQFGANIMDLNPDTILKLNKNITKTISKKQILAILRVYINSICKTMDVKLNRRNIFKEFEIL